MKLQYNLFDVCRIIFVTHGDLLAGSDNTSISSVFIDSRCVTSCSMFVALMGEKLDGHDYIEDALKNGARIVLVDAEHAKDKEQLYCELSKKYDKASFISVENTLKALQELAASRLQEKSILVSVAVTGSSGKTTVKEMIAAIFTKAGYTTFMTEGNLNSCTGVPLSILKMRGEQYTAAVFEVGMNRKGEIGEIVDVIRPRIAVITNVGNAHIGMLGSRDAIAHEKGEIFSHFYEGCTGVIPDCEYTQRLMEGRRGEFIVIDSAYLKRFEGSKPMGLAGCLLNYEGMEIHLPLLEEHNIYNAILAIAVAERYSVIKKEHIKEALEGMKAVPGRAELKKGFTTCLFDCYNANPESMEKAISFYDGLEWDGRKIAILGSMLELGEESQKEHEKVCSFVARTKSDAVFLMGEEMLRGFASFAKKNGADEVSLDAKFADSEILRCKVGEVEYFLYKDDEMEKLKKDVGEIVRGGDFVLLKASHGLHFEKLEDVLVGKKE